MGGMTQVSYKEHVAWVGGKPAPDWLSLDPSAPQVHRHNGQLRYLSGQGTTHEKTRREGTPKPFNRGDDLTAFIRQVNEHMITYGLDSTLYVPYKGEMVNILKSHALFDSASSLKTILAPTIAMWDDYAWKSNMDSILMFKHSIGT